MQGQFLLKSLFCKSVPAHNKDRTVSTVENDFSWIVSLLEVEFRQADRLSLSAWIHLLSIHNDGVVISYRTEAENHFPLPFGFFQISEIFVLHLRFDLFRQQAQDEIHKGLGML